jgi:hypothetical protein
MLRDLELVGNDFFCHGIVLSGRACESTPPFMS